jgi:hypothetical protein
VTDSILNKALEFLGQPTHPIPAPVEDPETEQLTPTHNYAQLISKAPEEPVEEPAEDPLLRANRELAREFPGLIFEDHDLGRVTEWLRTQEGVSLDIETYGTGRRKEERSKKALSFVQGTIRLIQLSAGGETFTLWIAPSYRPTP